MHGPRRVAVFCFLTAVLPTILIIIPLYLRHIVFADVKYEVAESDIMEISEGMSSIFCQEHTLSMNTTFSAFQGSSKPEPDTNNRKHIRLKKSMSLPDDTLEYWGFYLLKGATVALKVCSRHDGSRILVVRGERNLRTCGLLQHNINKPHLDKDHTQVKVTFETAAQEIEDSIEKIRIIMPDNDSKNKKQNIDKNTAAEEEKDQSDNLEDLKKYAETFLKNRKKKLNATEQEEEEMQNDQGSHKKRHARKHFLEEIRKLEEELYKEDHLQNEDKTKGNLTSNPDIAHSDDTQKKKHETFHKFNGTRHIEEDILDIHRKNITGSEMNKTEDIQKKLQTGHRLVSDLTSNSDIAKSEDTQKKRDIQRKKRETGHRLVSDLTSNSDIAKSEDTQKKKPIQRNKREPGDKLVSDLTSNSDIAKSEDTQKKRNIERKKREPGHKLVSDLTSNSDIEKSKDTQKKRDIQRKKRETGHKLDGAIGHGGTAINYTKMESNESDSVSSFEANLFDCYDGQILLTQGFSPSQMCNDVHYLARGEHMQMFHDVVSDGYYYYIFYSDNDIISNDIHAVFDIYKPTFQYTHSKQCINKTECSFNVSFFSDETVIVEVPTRDGIEHEEDDITLLLSKCKPRMAVYIIFPITILFLILGCAFL